jgi:hypothetical protein
MRVRKSAGILPLVALIVASACGEQTLTSSPDFHPAFAKAAGNGPTVKSTDPARGEPGVTMSVRVLGSGYNNGSKVSFGIGGVPSAKVTTNSTTFVSSTELVANITIAADADLDSYDVIVITSEGKKGIGTEIFLIAYAVADLGTVNNATSSTAYDVTQDGLIVGFSGPGSSPANSDHATSWRYISPTQIEKTDLHGLLQPAYRTVAFGVNLAGNIVGYRQLDAGAPSSRPFILSSAGAMTDLHSACGASETALQSHAYDISENNDVVGTQIVNGASVAIYWAPGSSCAAVLPAPEGATFTEATDISPGGAFIVGRSGDASNMTYPIRWSRRIDGTGWDVAILPGVPYGFPSTVMDDGGTVGSAQVSTLVRKRGSSYYDFTSDGYTWTAEGTVTKIPPMGNGDYLWVSGYGPLGLVGGSNLVIDGPSHAFVDFGDGPADLGVLVMGGNSFANATAGRFIVGRGDVNTPGRGIESHAMVWVAR